MNLINVFCWEFGRVRDFVVGDIFEYVVNFFMISIVVVGRIDG